MFHSEKLVNGVYGTLNFRYTFLSFYVYFLECLPTAIELFKLHLVLALWYGLRINYMYAESYKLRAARLYPSTRLLEKGHFPVKALVT